MEKKMKSVASIPANYVSVLQLKERWLKEKERKQKEGEKQEVGDGQGWREEENVMRVAEAMESLGGEKESKGFEKEKLEKIGGGDSSKKKKKSQSGSVKEVVKCEWKVSPAYLRRENNPVKERAYKSKEETAVETQLQDLWIGKRVKEEGGKTKEAKGPAAWSKGQSYYRNQKHDWSSRRVIKATGDMIWVKKEKKDGENAV